jgi:hypothetical protein
MEKSIFILKPRQSSQRSFYWDNCLRQKRAVAQGRRSRRYLALPPRLRIAFAMVGKKKFPWMKFRKATCSVFAQAKKFPSTA